MTPADNVAFEVIFTRVQKLYSKPKDGEMCRAYFDALLELPLAVVESASHALVKSSRYFPRPVDWLEAAFKIDTPKPGFAVNRWVTTAEGHTVRSFICLDCCDTGWRMECGCPFEAVNGRCAEHGTGSSASRMPVVACQCRETNPEFLQNHRTRHAFTEQR